MHIAVWLNYMCMQLASLKAQILWNLFFFFLFLYFFGVLRCFQHCTCHIGTGSWEGRGNQYRQLVKVLYCKLPTNSKQLPAFPLEVGSGTEPDLRGGRREYYHSATVAPKNIFFKHVHRYLVFINHSTILGDIRSPGIESPS